MKKQREREVRMRKESEGVVILSSYVAKLRRGETKQ